MIPILFSEQISEESWMRARCGTTSSSNSGEQDDFLGGGEETGAVSEHFYRGQALENALLHSFSPPEPAKQETCFLGIQEDLDSF